MKHLLHELHTIHVKSTCNDWNPLPYFRLFAVIDTFEIGKFLRTLKIVLRQDTVDILSFNGNPSMKHLLRRLHTIHANLTAMNGTPFLILDCF